MARGDQLIRQWKILHTLAACMAGKTAADLATDLGCSSRTVYRDLEALQAGGFPITAESKDNRSYWRILGKKSQVPPAFSLPELMALYFGRDMLRTYRGTVFYDAIESLLSKIKATLPPPYLDYLDRIRNTGYSENQVSAHRCRIYPGTGLARKPATFRAAGRVFGLYRHRRWCRRNQPLGAALGGRRSGTGAEISLSHLEKPCGKNGWPLSGSVFP